jgi:hypothetical protein
MPERDIDASEDESTDFPGMTRRGVIGALAAVGVGSGVAGAESDGGRSGDRSPFAPDDHDHSGERGATERLGVESPVESVRVDDLLAARQSQTVHVPALPAVSGTGTADDPYTSPSGTAGMREGFERLDEIGGGVIYFPSGFYGDGTTNWEIDLANYENLGNTNWSLRGDGLESSRIRTGNTDGDGIKIWDSDGTHFFYIEITGLRFEGDTRGFVFVLGGQGFENAFNSCWTRFATGGGALGDTGGACQLNFLLNSYHYGVHNSGGATTACELRRCQFSGFEGSVSAGESEGGIALDVVEYSFANLFQYLNVEATYDGIHIDDSRAGHNVFQNAYFANVRGTAFTQHLPDIPKDHEWAYPPGTYFHDPFVAGAVENIADVTGGTLYVDGSTLKWPDEAVTVQTHQDETYGGALSDAEHVGFTPRSTAPDAEPGRTALADGDGWDPDGDGNAELVIWNGSEWLEVVDMETTL